MINYAPVIATRQGALMEFIRHGKNGILLELPVNDLGEWSHQLHGPRDSKRYKENYFMEIERMAREALAHLEAIAERRENIDDLRKNARQEAVDKFDHESATAFWDSLYLEAANELFD